MVGDTKAGMVHAAADESEETMLFTFDKCEIVYRVMLHICWAKAVVDWTPGMHPPKNIEIPSPEIYDANLHLKCFEFIQAHIHLSQFPFSISLRFYFAHLTTKQQ